jgi:hypothetical protein
MVGLPGRSDCPRGPGESAKPSGWGCDCGGRVPLRRLLLFG